IPIMEKIMRQRFNGNYPARKSIQTEFAHDGGAAGMLFQLDAIACR
ncbi:TPA: RidA family protein, partial [Klebsiella pneumoniae]|nr:RidA family protein [Klebsiella pneumoniae]HBT4284698.1 RidA family protein [Klebsiella pneumoniae]HBT5050027.1 RidA family protein [Klebsiella pneumoniae]HBU1945664.1 RidA family protein [Klebsiella pneumoniae]HBU1951180.1 RidA family protein [Klebsiella pneumoniae]